MTREPAVTERDRECLMANFNAAAEGYDAIAVLQQTVSEALLERLDIMKLQPRRILDLGSGTGGAGRALAGRYPRSRVVQVDIAEKMLQTARRRSRRWFSRQSFVCADASRLPFRIESMDMVFSSLMLQWCEDLDRVFTEVRRLTRGGGLFLFSSLGPATLTELRESWAEAGDTDDVVHVNRFKDMHDVGDGLIRAGFADPVMEMDEITLTYPEVRDLMRELKQLGASNVNNGRRRTLTGKRRLHAMMRAYEQYRQDGRLPATYEVVYGHAWAPEGPMTAPVQNGVANVPVGSLRRRR